MKLSVLPPTAFLPELASPQTSSPSEAIATDSASSAVSGAAGSSATSRSLFFKVFSSTFVTIFLAELGDKTQLTTLLMAAESQAPWIVFAGAGAALITTSLLGVLLGQWLSTRLSPRTLETAAGISLLGVAATLIWDVLQTQG